jgi:hypothetical protein
MTFMLFVSGIPEFRNADRETLQGIANVSWRACGQLYGVDNCIDSDFRDEIWMYVEEVTEETYCLLPRIKPIKMWHC